MITAVSRYAQSALVAFNYENQDIAVIVAGQQQNFTFNFTNYQVVVGDRLDKLAYQFYLDPTKWWQIADANPEILDWSTLTEGMIIRIPFT